MAHCVLESLRRAQRRRSAKRAVENAKAYHDAFPSGPPFFTGATSLYDPDEGGLHFALSEALHTPALNLHDEALVNRLRSSGAVWAFYNEGSRWTFGEYLFKAAKEFNLQYRLTWHWNIVAGDPYYALDSREDDYAWANASPDGELVLLAQLCRLAGTRRYPRRRRAVSRSRGRRRGSGCRCRAGRHSCSARISSPCAATTLP